MNVASVSVVIPCKDDGENLPAILLGLADTGLPFEEVIVVDDGSKNAVNADDLSKAWPFRVVVVKHPYSMGNGAAVKAGARCAKGDYLLLMDADGQHSAEFAPLLYHRLQEGYDLVVGSRETYQDQASFVRAVGNYVYCKLASWVTHVDVKDLTSGYRLVNRTRFLEVLHILPNGFSYPTSSTMAFIRKGYAVAYEPIRVYQRKRGTSHLNPLVDGARFMLIIIKIATLFSPLKIFSVPAMVLVASGVLNYLISFFDGVPRLSNVSAVLVTSGLLLGAIGILSEQLTNILYHENNR